MLGNLNPQMNVYDGLPTSACYMHWIF